MSIVRALIETRPVIIAAIADDGTRARVSRSLRGVADLTFVGAPSRLVAEAASAPAAFLLTLAAGDGRDVATAVEAIRRRFPFVPTIVLCPIIGAIAADIVIAARAGITHLVFEDVDDLLRTVCSALEPCHVAAACDDAMRVLDPVLPVAVRPIFGYCVAHVRQTPSVDDIARHLRVHPRALCRSLRQNGLPSPAAVVSWSRLLVGVRLLANDAWPVERVALELGFSSASAFRTMLKRHTGLTLSALRHDGGLHGMLAVFSQRWQLTARSGVSQWGVVRSA